MAPKRKRKRSTQTNKQKEALKTLESEARRALRRLHELRLRELLVQLEGIMKQLQHASKLDQSQLRTLTRRGLDAINNFERQAGRPPIQTRMAKEGGGESGGAEPGQLNGSCEWKCSVGLQACMEVARAEPTEIGYDIAVALCEAEYLACMAICALEQWVPGGGGNSHGPGPSGGDNTGNDTGGDDSGAGCFVADTPVLMHDKTFKPIEQVTCGDTVLSKDEKTGAVTGQLVTRKWIHKDKRTLLLHLNNGETLGTTNPHRFFVNGKGFVPARNFKCGTCLVTQTEGEIRIVGIESPKKLESVFNLDVEGFHTFFVGNSAAWVHNAKIENGSDDNSGDDDGGDE